MMLWPEWVCSGPGCRRSVGNAARARLPALCRSGRGGCRRGLSALGEYAGLGSGAKRRAVAGTGHGRRVGNLPGETTGFVGRRAELAELGDLLVRSRLVTLTGVGGVGKTRLARRAADQARE